MSEPQSTRKTSGNPKPKMNMRKIHRWLGLPAAIFLVVTSITGVWLECMKFFGAEEAERERIRDMVSPVTAQTVGTEFGLGFEKARMAAVARAGVQPLDKMVWQLKSDAPAITFFFGPHGSQAGRRIAVNARTGEVQSEQSYEEDSFILKLHSGEALGDGGMVLGMFWGLALLLLTVSGMVIYFKMKPRKPQTGLRKVFWVLVGILTLTPHDAARADSPFFTDDPLFSPGWEIKLGASSEHNATGSTWAGPILDINYAIVPNIRLDLTMAEIGGNPDNGESATSFGTTDFKVKWRFLEEDPQSWLPAMSISPKVTLPTAKTSGGLSDGVWRAQLPIEFGKTYGNWYHFAEAGYQWAFDAKASDVAFWGVGTLYNFNKHLAVGTEIYGLTPLDQSADTTLATTFGVIYTFDANWSLKASISQSLRDDSKPGPNPNGVFYVVWNF
jgi:hypothetical protein